MKIEENQPAPFSREYFQKMGAIGGNKTLRKHGTEHYRKIRPPKPHKKLSPERGL